MLSDTGGAIRAFLGFGPTHLPTRSEIYEKGPENGRLFQSRGDGGGGSPGLLSTLLATLIHLWWGLFACRVLELRILPLTTLCGLWWMYGVKLCIKVDPGLVCVQRKMGGLVLLLGLM